MLLALEPPALVAQRLGAAGVVVGAAVALDVLARAGLEQRRLVLAHAVVALALALPLGAVGAQRRLAGVVAAAAELLQQARSTRSARAVHESRSADGESTEQEEHLQLVTLALRVAQLALVLVKAVEALLGGAARAPLRADVAAEVVEVALAARVALAGAP